MKKEQSKLWFRAKRYGWGWMPCSWEGWLFLALVLAQIIAICTISEQLLQTKGGIIVFCIICVSAIMMLFMVSYKTGEKPRWRWYKDT
jgi:hypothetical protein